MTILAPVRNRFLSVAVGTVMTVSLAACGGTVARPASAVEGGGKECCAGATSSTYVEQPADQRNSPQECCAATGTAGPAPTSADAAKVTRVERVHDGFDVVFILWMTPHDAIAKQMADLARTRATSQRVKDLAAQVAAIQGPRRRTMAAMAAAWGEPPPSIDPAKIGPEHRHDDAPSATKTVNDVARLKPLSGAAFDRRLLTMMIAHHKSALPMAQRTLDNGTNPQIKLLTRQILASQRAEIRQMQQLLAAMPAGAAAGYQGGA